MSARRYTWKPDLPDWRDHFFIQRGSRPDKVDLRPYCSPVEDQGALGSCTGNAIAGALEFHANKIALVGHAREASGKRFKTPPFANVSRLFIYYNERVIEHTVNQDAGAMIRDGVKSVRNTGYCDEALWPYVISKFRTKPSSAAYKQAASTKITSYQRCAGLEDVLQGIASGLPVVGGISVYESFEIDTAAKSGTIPMPKRGEKLLGGHAILFVGYSETNKRIIFRNSWGRGWGKSGYGTLPYAYIDDRNLSDDFWLIHP